MSVDTVRKLARQKSKGMKLHDVVKIQKRRYLGPIGTQSSTQHTGLYGEDDTNMFLSLGLLRQIGRLLGRDVMPSASSAVFPSRHDTLSQLSSATSPDASVATRR